MRVKDQNARKFYEIESLKSNWNVRQLQRQINSSLYERVALSRDKKELQQKLQDWIAEFDGDEPEGHWPAQVCGQLCRAQTCDRLFLPAQNPRPWLPFW